MKVFKTLVAILILLLIIFTAVYFYFYRLEISRVKDNRSTYSMVEPGSVIKWQGKIIEIDASARTILVQMYEYAKPVEDKEFYALNDTGAYKIERKVGDWVEIRGNVVDFIDDTPVVRTDYYNEWIYMYFDIGVFPPK